MSDTETFKLSRPIKTHNGETDTLTLREPTAGAFVDNGEPFKVVTKTNAEGEPSGIDIVYDNNRALLRFIVDMVVEKVDEIILKSLSAADFMRLRGLATNIILVGIGPKDPTVPSAG